MTTPQQDRDQARKDIKEDGAPLRLSYTPSGYDAEQSEAYSGRELKFDTFGADWEYKLSDIDGTLIQQGDLRLIVAGLEGMPDPEPGWSALYGGVKYRAISCKPIRKAAVSIAYDLQLRKG